MDLCIVVVRVKLSSLLVFKNLLVEEDKGLPLSI